MGVPCVLLFALVVNRDGWIVALSIFGLAALVFAEVLFGVHLAAL
jgi:hypothetical protein